MEVNCNSSTQAFEAEITAEFKWSYKVRPFEEQKPKEQAS